MPRDINSRQQHASRKQPRVPARADKGADQSLPSWTSRQAANVYLQFECCIVDSVRQRRIWRTCRHRLNTLTYSSIELCLPTFSVQLTCLRNRDRNIPVQWNGTVDWFQRPVRWLFVCSKWTINVLGSSFVVNRSLRESRAQVFDHRSI